MSRVRAILQRVRGPSVLDVGCTGYAGEHIEARHWVHRHLREKFTDVAGIDLNADLVRVMTERGYKDVSVADAEDLQLDRTFDTIVAGQIMEHLSNPGRFLECCRRHLVPGGRLVVTVPYPFALVYLVYALFKYPRTSSEPTHTLWFCPGTMRTLAAHAGFEVRHTELVEDYLPGVYKSAKYTLSCWLVRILRFLPMRLRGNCALFVLERSRAGVPT